VERFQVKSLLKLDFVGRALLTIAFAGFFALDLMALGHLLSENPARETFALDLTARVAGLAFMCLAIVLTVFRLPPRSDSLGWMPRIAAIAGTFMTLTIVVLPQADMNAVVRLAGATLTIVGTVSSIYCLMWLGRSFSIDAQARRLVTGGPYSLVRHPLYVAEAVSLAGLTLSSLSVWAVTIAVATLLVQYWRILNEELILSRAFPEYAAYMVAVPRIAPRLWARSVPPVGT
jgi:protein-S-isoprenylcysteine O-methyltransferase Ste14